MTKCLRIFNAYSFRLTRRYSTLLLIFSFLTILTIILHFYVQRHQKHLFMRGRTDDSDYKPGCFLKGQLPNYNESYCKFNYGLPKKLEWSTFRIHTSPELGSRSHYRVIYNAITATDYANISEYDVVTYATQATPEFIYHVVEIAKYWEGPISLSVFVPNYDFDIAIQIMDQLCRCYSGMSKVSLHLFYPKMHPPVLKSRRKEMVTTEMPTTTSNITLEELNKIKLENYRNLNNKTRARYIQLARQKKIALIMRKIPGSDKFTPPDLIFPDCSGLEKFDVRTFRKENNMVYPINVGRNVARNASRTNYFLVSDIEMVPSDGLAPQFLAMVRKLMGDKKRDEGCVFAKTVFVVPLFEVERGEEIPRDKDTLVRMVAAKRAMYFHQKFCSHCQRFPGLQSWLLRPSNDVEPVLITRREYPYHRWEPLYFGTHKEPWYSEVLSWEGRQDKMTQMLELCLQEYRMVVLNGAFLCHAATSKPSTKNPRAEKVNAQKYLQIIETLKRKYPERPQCKIEWRC